MMAVYLSFCTYSEFSVHHTLLREGQSGFVECLVRRRDQFVNPITDLGTEEMRIIYSSGFTQGDKYVCMTYNLDYGGIELSM